MIAMITGLIASGHAYEAAGHVLFRVRSYKDYGKLSGRSIDDMIAGARVEVAPFKEDPMDFVLWKPSSGEEPGWESPWGPNKGRGRPGWHIECSAMAHELLGESFDIHGGGLDLQFPHHENEIAQSACAHPHGDFAHYWLHNEMLQVEGKKMSKSLGNFFTVRDLLDQGIPGEVIRYVLLMTHYRSPMDWTAEKVRQAEGHLSNWNFLKQKALSKAAEEQIEQTAPDATIISALADDLNTSLAVNRLYKLAEAAHFAGKKDSEAALTFFATLKFLGFDNLDTERLKRRDAVSRAIALVHVSALEEELARLRADAMISKDFAAVDALKSALITAGVEVRMSKDGVELVPGPDFDPAKLEALQ
jgi:cysteinyl-tRNA synthetase